MAPNIFEGWRKAMKTLAQAPNSPARSPASEWGLDVDDSIRPYVEETIAAFGVRRCVFASNFPVDKLFSTYDAIWNAFKEITSGYSQSERMALFHDNAASFYRL